MNFINVCHKYSACFAYLQSLGALEVCYVKLTYEVVFVFSSVNFKTFLVSLVSNTISHFWAKHHLVALHEIIHHSFKCWHECLLIYHVEIYLIIGCHLDSYIAFNIVNQTFMKERCLKLPGADSCVLIFFSLEEEYFVWWSNYQAFVVNQEHLS